MVGAFFIPEGSFGKTSHIMLHNLENKFIPVSGEVWMYFGSIGAFLFILIQLILIIDFAHSWAEAWVGNYEETEHKSWLGMLLTATFLMFALAVTAVGLFFAYWTGEHAGQCKLHEFFISFNLIICVIISVISVLPKIQEHMPKSGLLQSGGISCYIMYLTWSAMSNSPIEECKFDYDFSKNGSAPTPTPAGHPRRPARRSRDAGAR